ncbi:MAG: hypothetical protein MUF49_06575 [Oculatellaceae cyanobacterium Prado106]|jgi:hypothetical protein|nr:hypothetical protein [Oculatellaceae cyanobacterium Prado106]
MTVKVIPSQSLKAFRYRVHVLEQDLWKEKDPTRRANLALQLAEAVTALAQLEVQAVKNEQSKT